jgi:Protein of unknown function (DUF4232)
MSSNKENAMHLPTLSPRRLAGGAALVCAAALLPVAAFAATGSPAARAASTPACTTNDLVVWMDNAQGAAGTYYYTLNFTNLSRHACDLRGHPGVSAVNLTGGQIGAPAGWGKQKLRTVRIARGRTATAALAVTDVGVFTPRSCRQVTASGWRVYPPGQYTAKYVPYPFGACSTPKVFMSAGVVRKQK